MTKIYSRFAPWFYKYKYFWVLLLLSVNVSAAPDPNPKNALRTSFNQPINYKYVTSANIKEATDQVIAETRVSLARIYAIPKGKHTFNNTMLAADDFNDKIASVFWSINILANASPDSAIRKQAQRSLETISKYRNEIGLDEKLYQAVKAFSLTPEAKTLTGGRKKMVKEQVEQYERNGFTLSGEKRQQLKGMNDNITKLELTFSNNIATYKDHLLVSEANMKGLPEDFIKSRKKEGDQYIINLDGPAYTTFMKFAESDQARRELFIKYNNRAADKNVDVLQQLLVARQKKAKHLGYPTYAAYLTAERMAKTPETVWNFENNLIAKVKQKAQADLNELLGVKRAHLNNPAITSLNPWENAFYNNLLMKQKYQVDEEKIKEYLALDNVLSGLFQTTQQLFGIKYEEVKNASVWHPDVRMFEVKQNGATLGRFYLDLHPRDDKFTHAACSPIRFGKQYSQGYQIPTAALICNFNAPTEGKPALLTHSQAVTFFHEFGHVLHSILAKTELAGQTAMAVKWDFVEAPSQIFENWVWNYDVLKLFARHYKTGEVMSQTMYQKMWEARNVGSGLAASAQIFYGILDMTLHDKYDPAGPKSTTEVLKEVQNSVMLFPYLEGTHLQASFGHLTGYGASVYGYMWSKVYAEDMFSVFEKNGVMDPKTGMRYRNSILANGSSRDELEMVKEFLGREPNQEAFFKSLGL
ncbi:M3 family metallopeptidase [Adhaeribacter rhizoryzae]|uniref:Zn-dependent oligopeptidase n=1 Tax=Adhaeribacter rhizoryzae TaxID=2607907 RepID=A0A5M6D6K4_9BACT|nr:M3 family metallopeptidase [Adhaeribacter rhizoryzae]KAA5540825.1 Zn-dependent oligopeptidase [Adhaeribacter rhizoryzae]